MSVDGASLRPLRALLVEPVPDLSPGDRPVVELGPPLTYDVQV